MSDDRREQLRQQLADRYRSGSDTERGTAVLAMLGYAAASVVVDAGLVVSVALSATRIWRRRDQGLAQAVRSGHWRAVVGFTLAASAVQVAGRPLGKWLAADR